MPRTTNRPERFIAAAGLGGSLVAVMALLGACDYFGRFHMARAAHGSSQAASAQKLDPAAKALAAMVDAVGPSGAAPPVELKFSIRSRPEVGQEVEVDYALVPEDDGIKRIDVAFDALDGLKVSQHGPKLAALKPSSSAPIFGSVIIRPVKSGLFTLTAAVGVQTDTQSLVLPFRMPIIAGEGPAQTAARTP